MPKDPLEALGPSIVLHTLTFLPLPSLLSLPQVSKSYRNLFEAHKVGIFRPACKRFGMKDEVYDRLVTKERQLAAEPELPPGAGGPDTLDWKDELRKHTIWSGNWRQGKCVDRWIASEANSTWRFKIDEEDGTCLMTSRDDDHGLNVVDASTSERLFAIRGVREFAHLEFSNGYAVFDTGHTQLPLEVWRTRNAIGRSADSGRPVSHGQTLPHHDKVVFSDAGVPLPYPEDLTHCSELPRGHLAFYRPITPPESCRAFRARLDRKGSSDERTVLCTAGVAGVYIYDLDSGSLITRIRRHGSGDITYVELDDDYVFLCSRHDLSVFSRHSSDRVLAYPDPEHDDNRIGVAVPRAILDVVYRPSETESYGPNTRKMQSPRPHASPESVQTLSYPTTEAWGTSIRFEAITEPRALKPVPSTDSWPRVNQFDPRVSALRRGGFDASDDNDFLFTSTDKPSCHYTDRDLVYISLEGIFVTANFRQILTIENAKQRYSAWKKSTVRINAYERVRKSEAIVCQAWDHLSTCGSKAVVASYYDNRLIYFDTTSLRDLWASDREREGDERGMDSPSREERNSRAADSTETGSCVIEFLPQEGFNGVSCLQVDHDRIYMACEEERRREHPHFPDAISRGYGVSVRVWDFGV